MSPRRPLRGRRPPIPYPTQRILWARAAGRCEFRGCNELIDIDQLTQRRSNLSTIAHIVSYSPIGPRGDAVRSPQLATDISNLMLCCLKHSKIIDDDDKVEDYPEDLLLEFKREHEDRIRLLTDITDESQTHVLVVNVPIDGQSFEISIKAAYKAILPKYSDSEVPTVIDLSSMTLPPNTEGVFAVLSAQITSRVRDFHARFFHGHPDKPISLFALGPIPLLVHIGYELGDIVEVDLYQRHRDSQSWNWQETNETDDETDVAKLYTIETPAELKSEAEVVIAISISASVSERQVEAVAGQRTDLYTIRANDPGYDFLHSKVRLKFFGYEFRRLLEVIRAQYGRSKSVHLIGALPSPVAVEIGRSIRAHHPPFKVYEYDKPAESYFEGLIINE